MARASGDVPSAFRSEVISMHKMTAYFLGALANTALFTLPAHAQGDVGVAAKINFQVKPDAKLTALLPQDMMNKGYLVAGTNPNTPPTTFFLEDNKTLSGRDIDIMNAIGQRLGLKVVWKDIGGFDNIIPGL